MALLTRHLARNKAVTLGHRMSNWRTAPSTTATDAVTQAAVCTVCGRTVVWRDTPGPFDADAEGLAIIERCFDPRAGDPKPPRTREGLAEWTVQYNGQFRTVMAEYIGRTWEQTLDPAAQHVYAQRWLQARARGASPTEAMAALGQETGGEK